MAVEVARRRGSELGPMMSREWVEERQIKNMRLQMHPACRNAEGMHRRRGGGGTDSAGNH
jgi:hypothetical protein